MTLVCPSCGRENPDDARFCAGCATRLAVVSSPVREERKVVTVVYADMVGSTARAERLDPEDVRAILAPYHARLRQELERFGGTVEKFIGDAVVGVFGAPIAHEDDPERAVRAALAIQEAIEELNERHAGLELQVRIGVATGEALVSVGARPAEGESMVSGDVMNTGARLQAAAPPAGVLVSDATYRSTLRAIEYRDADPVEAKGKAEPLRVWLAVAPRARFGVDVFQSGGARLVGRESELDLLTSALARARAKSEPQLVTLVGVPGIGKSRLVFELSRIVDDDPELIVWRQGRSLPYGEGVAFWALGEIVKAQAGIFESDGAVEAGEKLVAAVSDLLSEESEAAWVERHLRPLVGLGGDANRDQDSTVEAFAAWRRFFEALAEQGPTVLVLEDLQWADDGLLDFVDGLVERVAGVPLLIVCSARPELLERRPGWGGGKRNALTVSLAPLSEDDTARLIATLLDRPVLAAEEQSALLQRAGGNPLYAEEFARMLAGGELVAGDVPETLQGVVAARIDALPPVEKELLQLAAVFGKVFWTDALAVLSGVDAFALDERLHALERKEFVRREHRSAVAAAKQYVFVHALVRDGAYGQMPRAVRAHAHRQVAEWIDSLPSDRAEDRAEMLAHHLVQAIEYGRAGGIDVAPLIPRAGQALRDAGDRAWALGAPGTALGFYERSRELDPGSADDSYLLLRLGRALFVVHGRGEVELDRAAAALTDSDPAAAAEAEVARGEIVWHRGDRDGSAPYFDRAAATVEDLPPSRQKLFVVGQVARFLALAGRNREGLELAERAIAMAEELGDKELLSDALNTRGIARRAIGDLDGIGDIERSLALALEINSWRAGRGYINLGSELLTAGEVASAEAAFREGLRFAERLGNRLSLRWIRGNLVECTFHLGLWDESLDLAEGEIADPEPHYLQQLCRLVRAHMRLMGGDERGALEDAELAARDARAIRDPQALIPALASRAFCIASIEGAGVARAALTELDDARRVLAEQEPAGPWVVWLAFALLEIGSESELSGVENELGLPTPWRDAALAIGRRDLVSAADILRAIGSVALEAHVRLEAARGLAAEGRQAEAAAQLSGALSFYRGVGAARAVREGEALLAAAS
jgi:class 3 adenylate cyclase/tetratricopeptide (TPR) repeat protein